MPLDELLGAVAAFNVGVEVGQLAWALALFGGLRALPGAAQRNAVRLGSLALLGVGLYWSWQRAGLPLAG